jgi:hypothetical protein
MISSEPPAPAATALEHRVRDSGNSLIGSALDHIDPTLKG